MVRSVAVHILIAICFVYFTDGQKSNPPPTGLPPVLPTSAPVTFAAPPSAGMSTPKPTTAKGTTAKGTTAKGTTAKGTTAKATTAKATTAGATTAKGTTAKVTTAQPTTAKPITAHPTKPKSGSIIGKKVPIWSIVVIAVVVILLLLVVVHLVLCLRYKKGMFQRCREKCSKNSDYQPVLNEKKDPEAAVSYGTLQE